MLLAFILMDNKVRMMMELLELEGETLHLFYRLRGKGPGILSVV